MTHLMMSVSVLVISQRAHLDDDWIGGRAGSEFVVDRDLYLHTVVLFLQTRLERCGLHEGFRI